MKAIRQAMDYLNNTMIILANYLSAMQMQKRVAPVRVRSKRVVGANKRYKN